MKTLFELCSPRQDILSGGVNESDYAADLAQVLRGEGPEEYRDAATFFANTHPTQGLRALLENVCRRLSGAGGEAASIFRLDTQYGGGKTHALIALAHLVRSGHSVPTLSEFLNPELLPTSEVRIGVFDGENSDPFNGRLLDGGLRAYTPWGELACQLGGAAGYRKVRDSDQERMAPGAETLRSLFEEQPSLILLDELSIYLRRIRRRTEEQQLTPFLTNLFKAAANSTIFLVCRPRPQAAPDKHDYWEEVEPLVKQAVRQKVDAFQQAGIRGVDLYLSCFGPALEEFARHWPLRRGNPKENPATRRRQQSLLAEAFDPYAVTPEDALEAARELLDQSGAPAQPGFENALQAVLEVLPVSSTFTHVADESGPIADAASDFEVLENLRRLAFSAQVPQPEQLKLWL